MQRLRVHLGIILAAILGAGCYPQHIISSPAATGTVLDRHTRQPLAGVQVAISRAWQRAWPDYGTPTLEEALAGLRPPTVTTGTNGEFYIPSTKKWIMEFPPPEDYARGTLVVQKDGYQPALLPLEEFLREDLGNIYLTPMAGRLEPPP